MEIQQVGNTPGGGYQPAAAKANLPDGAQPGSVANAAGVAAAVAPAPTRAVQQAAAAPKPQEVKESVEKINKTVQAMSRNLQFSVDESTQMNVVKVVDIETKDVIRQIPSEEVLAIAKALDKLQGLLLKEKA
jgi:flagellar protein FlaG